MYEIISGWIKAKYSTHKNITNNDYNPISMLKYQSQIPKIPPSLQIGGDTIRGQQQPAQPLTVYSKMEDVARTMAQPTSGKYQRYTLRGVWNVDESVHTFNIVIIIICCM